MVAGKYLQESKIEQEVVKFAESKGWLVRKVGYICRRGAPDRWFFGPNGRLVMIEFKRPNKQLQLLQEREAARLKSRGFEVYKIDNIEDGYAIFQ